MKRAIFLAAALIFGLSVTVMADPGDTLWTRTYGGSNTDVAYSVQQTADEGYIIAGCTNSFGAGDFDFYIVKTDLGGDTLWTRTYGGSSEDIAYSVQQITDGGYIITGWTESFGIGSSDFFLVKTDASGDTLWTRTYGGSSADQARSVLQTTDGGYIIAGRTESFGAGAQDFYLVKTDAGGDSLWTRTYGGSNNDIAYSVLQTVPDGGYIIAGCTESFGAGSVDFYIVKTDANGNTLWTRTYGGGYGEEAFSAQQTTDGGYIIAGCTASFGAGGSDFYLVKTDSIGTILWARTYGGSSLETAYSTRQTTDGGYIISGETFSFGAGTNDFYLVKTDASGDTLWTRTYGGVGADWSLSTQQTTDGGYIIAGQTFSFGAGGYDFYLVKTMGDNAYPSITNTIANPQYPKPEEPCEVSATITDQDGIIPSADLYYDTGSGYTPLAMSNVADSFFATIPGQPESTLVNYYISATDNQGAVTVSDTMAYFVVDKVARIYMAPMDPPIEIPPGGYFQFVGILQNKTPLPQAIDVWIMLDVPGIGQYGPIMRFNNLSLAPDQIISSPGVRQDIPIFAPLGVYDYIAYCGIYEDIFPELIIDSASFQFTVVPGQISDGANGWNLSGWFDENIPIEVPAEFSLSNNYPNPFNAATTISYQLPQSCNVNLDIYNLAGQKVATLENGYKEAGEYSVSWNAANYASGIYFYRLTAGDNIITRRMTLLK